jgi:hypothetical protein
VIKQWVFLGILLEDEVGILLEDEVMHTHHLEAIIYGSFEEHGRKTWIKVDVGHMRY